MPGIPTKVNSPAAHPILPPHQAAVRMAGEETALLQFQSKGLLSDLVKFLEHVGAEMLMRGESFMQKYSSTFNTV